MWNVFTCRKKICVTIRDFSGYYIVLMNYMKNSFASILLLVWKRGPPRLKGSYECSSPHTPYHIPLPKKRGFAKLKSLNAETPEGSLRVLFRFHIDRVLFRFLSDRVYFRVFLRVLSDRVLLMVHNDRFLFESLVIGSPSGSSLIDSFPGSSVLFFRHAAIFYLNVLLLFD